MRKLLSTKFLIALCCFIAIAPKGFTQTTIFSENIGVPTATTTIAAYTGWQNNGVLTFSNGGAASPADVRITSVSGTYAGASAGGNIFFTSTSGNYGFSIESINAAIYNTLVLQFGYRKETAGSHAALSVEYWDGTAWVVIANTSAALFNEAGTAATGWYLSKALSLPAEAQINGLKIRFVKSGTASIRVDDIKLTGVFSNPTTTGISPSAASVGAPGFTLTVNGTNFSNTQSTVTWNGANRTTTYVSATQLTAAIPGTDLSGSGVALVGVTTTGAAAVSNTQSFTINAASGGTLTLTGPLTGFGNVCINTTTPANSFTLDGASLDGSDIVLAALPGFAYSTTLGGTYTSTLNITYTGNSFTGQTIYVKFNPTAVQSYDGTINLSGGGLLASYPVTATGTGVNTLPAVTTGGSSAITATSGTVAGTINDAGCGTITAYGIEYSLSSGFPDGSGTQIPCSNLSAGVFSTTISGLLPNTRYYYKAYGVSTVGTTYGTQQAFNASPLPVPMSSQPGLSYTQDFSDIGTWGDFFTSGNGANHFGGLSVNLVGSIPDGIKVTASTSNFQGTTFTSSGGVHRFIDPTTPVQSIILLSTGSPDNTTSAAIDFYMDFTGVNAGTLSFDYATINNSTGNRNGSLRVYATIDGVTFTELPFADVLDFTNNVAISGSKSNIALPAMFNNSATARLRFYYHNGSGNLGSGSRPKISIDNLNVTAVATTPCVSPTAPATNLTFGTITDVSIQGSFTASSPAADNYIVVQSVNSSLTGNPVDGQIYDIGDNLGDGTVIAKSNSTSFTATGLTASSQYYFFVFPLNSVCTGGPLYYSTTVLNGTANTIAGLPPCTAPTTQPTALTFGATGVNSIQGSFTATTADEYLVLRSTSPTLSNNPANAQVYNIGDALGNAIVVERSTATSFTANGLLPNTPYYFFVFSINSSACVNGPVYNITNPLNGTQTTQPLPPCATPVAQPSNLVPVSSNTQVSATFLPVAGADNYLVIASTSPTLSAAPVDNTDYNVGDNFGGGVVIANTNLTTFLNTGLTANTTYYYFVFAANSNCSGGTKYATGAALTASIVTANFTANNYYFGTLHSHSDYSDGNQDHPGYTPTNDYAYAMTAQCMDYLGISEHNHFSTANNPGNTISLYHSGPTEANTFTAAHPGFLALYGMEWGVISGGGHVVVYGDGMDDLWGWESGSGAWGATNNYDVYVPKSTYTGSTGLFKTVNDNVAKNTFATLAHPNLTDYNNLAGIAYDAVADNAITGAAVESGPATSTNTTYSNPGSPMSYLWYYQTLLSKGYHLGPTIDHDNHNTTFGHATYSRTAIIAPELTKTAIISGMRNMNFYATQDCDSKVDFTINTKIMGSSILDRYAPIIQVTLTDATTTTTNAVIRVMYGVPGSNILPVKIDSVIGNTLRFTDINLANNATGYYYIDISNGTSRIITSPIWYTRNDNSILAVKLNAFDVQKVGNTAKITWSTEQEINSNNFIIERSLDGRTWTSIATVPAAGNSSRHIDYSIFDNAPMKGINYYRLKEVDKDAKYDYSDIKKAIFKTNYTAMVAPNPATDVINLYISKTGNQLSTIQLLNTEGKIVYKTTSTQSQLQINTTTLTKGLYFVKVIDADNVTTIKVSVQ